MRKNSPRHWLHAVLDLLPVILIPVFMIYSHRHTIDSYSVTRQERENQPYNFYQGVENGKPLNTSNIESYNVSNMHIDSDGDFGSYLLVTSVSDENSNDLYIDFNLNINIPTNNKYYVHFNFYCLDYEGDFLSVYLINNINELIISEDITISQEEFIEYSYLVTNTDTGENQQYGKLRFLIISENYLDYFQYFIKNVQIFNLTSIFGSGNEPTKEEFESMLTQDYYNYGNNYVDNYVTVTKTYNDTDIMSQFTYNLYNSVDKYFNMGNVFGMNNVYSWFETNIFHGTAPLYIYIVWNIILYEFVMDLLFLLYALFMWFVDVTKRLVEKPLDSIK